MAGSKRVGPVQGLWLTWSGTAEFSELSLAPCPFSSPPAAYPNFRHSLYIGSYLLSISFTKSWIQGWGSQLSWESDCCHRLGDPSFILGTHVSGSCEFIISSSGADRDRGILRAWWPASRAYVVTSRFTPLKGCGAIYWLGQAQCTQELTAATVTCTGPVQEQAHKVSQHSTDSTKRMQWVTRRRIWRWEWRMF